MAPATLKSGGGGYQAELERIDRGVVAVSVAVPLAEQEGDRHQVGVQICWNLERHGHNSAGTAVEPRHAEAGNNDDRECREHHCGQEDDLHDERV